MKKIISLLLVLVMVVSLCSCSLFGKNSVISVGIVNDIVSLDPTRATGDAEKLIVSNCFEGLVRFDENGAINLAAATSYSVDKTGCVYTLINNRTEYAVTKAGKAKGVVYIEDTYKNKPVTEIASGAFRGNSKITEIHIGNNVKTIGNKVIKKRKIYCILVQLMI